MTKGVIWIVDYLQWMELEEGMGLDGKHMDMLNNDGLDLNRPLLYPYGGDAAMISKASRSNTTIH